MNGTRDEIARRTATWAVFLAGCSGPAAPSNRDAGVDGPRPADPRCSDLFDQDVLPTFEVELPPETLADLLDDDEFVDTPYHALSTFRYEDEVVYDAQIRVRGNAVVLGKTQFQISFNENDPDSRFHGLRKLTFDAPPYDPTLLRNRLAASILLDLGLPISCTNNARLVINGEYYGLFANIEHVDRELLERTFGDAFADGNLFKDGQTQVTNEDVPDATRISDFWASQDDLAALDRLGDVDQWLAFWVGDAVLPHHDGFCCAHNFYLYDHPTRGFVFVGWDYDLAFDAWYGGNANGLPDLDPRMGTGGHALTILADDAHFERWVAEIGEALPFYDAATLVGRIDDWEAQLAEAVAEDDTIVPEERAAAVASLRLFVAERAAYLADWFECMNAAPGEADPDRDGYNWCSWCPGGGNAGVELCDGGDNDCDGTPDDDCTDCATLYVNDRPHVFCLTYQTWENAEAFCQSVGGTLAVPRSREDEIALYRVARQHNFYDTWLGVHDLDGDDTFTDASGAPLAYSGFHGDEPSADTADRCVGVTLWIGSWDARPCSQYAASICELP